MKNIVIHSSRLLPSVSLVFVLLVPGALRAAEDFTIETARQASKSGDAKAEYFLARHYAKGEGVTQNNAEAAKHMQAAAERGLAYAQNDLGAYYAKGFGVTQDFTEAANWYRKAAEQGDALAQFSLGRSYSLGRGVPLDLQESIKWFKKSAAQNQPDALLELGDIFLSGRKDIKTDYPQAFEYFSKAVQLGRVSAYNSLGFIYEHGYGKQIDPQKAVECYRTAAEKNDARAQMNLGRMYEEGLGVKKDLVEAYKWFCLAQRNGEGIGTHYIEELEDTYNLPIDQIKEARARADEFLNAHSAKGKNS